MNSRVNIYEMAHRTKHFTLRNVIEVCNFFTTFVYNTCWIFDEMQAREIAGQWHISSKISFVAIDMYLQLVNISTDEVCERLMKASGKRAYFSVVHFSFDF
jgi:hypothetical protein